MKELPALLKIVILIGSSTLVLASFNTTLLSVTLFLLLVAMFFTKSRKKIYPRLKALFPAGILIFILQLAFSPGVPLNDKLLFSYTVFSKLVVVSMMVLYFVSTTSPARIVSAFFFLSEDMRLMLTMTFYFIPLIFDEAFQIMVVQKSVMIGKNVVLYPPAASKKDVPPELATSQRREFEIQIPRAGHAVVLSRGGLTYVRG